MNELICYDSNNVHNLKDKLKLQLNYISFFFLFSIEYIFLKENK